MNEDRIQHKILVIMIDAKRRKGRSRNHWEDEMSEDGNVKNWKECIKKWVLTVCLIQIFISFD